MDLIRRRHIGLFLIILVLMVALFGIIFVVLNNFNMELGYLHNQIDRMNTELNAEIIVEPNTKMVVEEERMIQPVNPVTSYPQ